MFKALLRNIDMFSTMPLLMYKGNTRINSLAGGLFSLFAFTCLIISAIYFSGDLYNRTHPHTFNKISINNNIPIFNFSINKNLTIAIQNPPMLNFGNLYEVQDLTKLFDFNNSFITEDNVIISPYIKLYAAYIYMYDEEKQFYKINNLKIHNCSDHNFSKNFLCVDLSNSLLGNGSIYDEKPENYVQIYIDICRNSSELPFKCKSESHIEEWIEKMEYLLILKPEIQIQLDNFSNPIENKFSIDKIPLRIDSFFERTLFYNGALLQTDSGIVFEELSEIKFIQFSLEEDIYMIRTSQDVLVNIKMFMTNNHIYYRRNFAKVQQVFANIGGILQLILTVFKTVSKVFVQKSYYLKLSRGLWDSNVQTIKENNNPGQTSRLSLNNSNIQKFSLKTDKNINCKNEKFLKYSVREYLISVICLSRCKNEKLRKNEIIYDMGMNRIKRRLDVVEISKYFIEIDRLKYILFDESQVSSLNYLRNRKIEFNVEYIKDEVDHEKFALEYYDKIHTKKTLKKIETKILSLLEKNLFK